MYCPVLLKNVLSVRDCTEWNTILIDPARWTGFNMMNILILDIEVGVKTHS